MRVTSLVTECSVSAGNKNAFSMLRGLFPVRKPILSSGEVDFRFSDSRNLAMNLKV